VGWVEEGPQNLKRGVRSRKVKQPRLLGNPLKRIPFAISLEWDLSQEDGGAAGPKRTSGTRSRDVAMSVLVETLERRKISSGGNRSLGLGVTA
jgi:hypothetical protein